MVHMILLHGINNIVWASGIVKRLKLLHILLILHILPLFPPTTKLVIPYMVTSGMRTGGVFVRIIRVLTSFQTDVPLYGI